MTLSISYRNKSRPEPNREAVAAVICGRKLFLMGIPQSSVVEKTYSRLKGPLGPIVIGRKMARQVCCGICKEEIMISSPDFPQLCIVCGREFMEMIRAVAELSIEMAGAYGVNPLKEGRHNLPGVPIEEIEIRMELNRLKKNVLNTI